MKKLHWMGLATLCFALCTGQADAFGRKGGCNTSCYDSCAPAMTVSYVQKQVTCYEPVWKKKTVTVPVTKCEYKMVKEPVEYTECVPEWKDVMQPCVKYEMQKVPVEYTECVPEWKDVMQPCVKYEMQKVPVEYTECVPNWKDVVCDVTTLTYKPTTVMKTVTSCQMVPTCVTDPCTGCTYTVCKPQTVSHQVPCTTYQCVPVTTQVTKKVCEYSHVKKQGEAWKCVPVQTQVAVKVCEYKHVKKQGEAWKCVPVQTQVPVKVCEYKHVKKQGFVEKCVAETKTEDVTHEVSYCEWQAVTRTVNVPVCVPVTPAPCVPHGQAYGQMPPAH